MTKHGQITIIKKKQLAKMLGVSPSTIYRMNKSQSLPKPLYCPSGYIKGWLSTAIDNWVTENSR
ncbi:helix-turn-helix transcriptional regulator [uncultured Photobacterium sp.]|uniref:helix-turn-helix transcriptional regulator n=1 Tax=uncultured Photobacterium sp. TaxID=173973 RepID=UPI00345DD0A0